MSCRDCGGGPCHFRSPFDNLPLCSECARREILGILEGLDLKEMAKLRRRVEDHLRKSPADLIAIICRLAAKGSIEITDII